MKLFRWFCSKELQRFVEGDLIELYRERSDEKGRNYANIKILIDVVSLFRPGLIGFAKGLYSNNNLGMIKNYLKVGFRNLWKDRFYTGINLFGLSVGLAFSFLVLLLVNYEFSYEQFYANKEQIKRLGVHYNVGGKEDTYCNVGRPLGPTMMTEYPEVLSFTRVAGVNGLDVHKGTFKYKDKFVKSNDAYIVDSAFFEVFDRKILKGSSSTMLNRPNTIALSESMATKIFGNENPIGKHIELADRAKKFEVTGVFEDVPGNTHLPYDVLVSWNKYYDAEVNSRWYGAHVYSYVKLQDSFRAQYLIDDFSNFFEKHMSTYFAQLNATADLIIQDIEDIHLRSDLTWEVNQNGDLTSVYVLLAIGIFLVVIALVNYLNLSLARNSLRKKEISVRKVIGASRFNISGQFLVETLLFTLLAFAFSLLIVKIIDGQFQLISGVDVLPFTGDNILIFAASTFMLGLIISVYPSLVLSSIKLVEGLKGRSKNTRDSGKLQQGLVVLQFAISTIVILFTFVVKNQLDFVSNKDLGFQKDNVVVFQLEDSLLSANSELIKQQVKTVAGVANASFASNRPGVNLNHSILNIETEGGFSAVGSQYMQVDNDFAETIGLELLEGRAFINGSQQDSDWSFMLNEAAKLKFDWDEPIGKVMYFNNDEDGNPRHMKAIGVFKDFNIGSLHAKVEPIVVFYNKDFGNQLLVRLEAGGHRLAIQDMEEIFETYAPKLPVSHSYLDVELDRQYVGERRLAMSMGYLSALTIIISVLGFVGLLSFAISKRQSEIGVRKVLGASVKDVTFLFYKQILILILLAECIAIPVNHYVSTQWLNSFQYKSFPSYMELGLVLLIIIVLSMAIMGFQILKVAVTNPVDIIKEE
ncbi:MAG: ABC transporter permease [Roseivirga sp.]